MNLLYLFLNIHPLHILRLIQLPVITQRRPLPPGLLLLTNNRLPSHPIENVRPLRGKPLEVGGYVRGGEVGCLGAGVGFQSLFFPTGVQEFDCNIALANVSSS